MTAEPEATSEYVGARQAAFDAWVAYQIAVRKHGAWPCTNEVTDAASDLIATLSPLFAATDAPPSGATEQQHGADPFAVVKALPAWEALASAAGSPDLWRPAPWHSDAVAALADAGAALVTAVEIAAPDPSPLTPPPVRKDER